MLAAVLADPPAGSDSGDTKAVVVTTVPLPQWRNPAYGATESGEALIRLEYAGLNRRDDWMRRGMYPGPLRSGQQIGADGCGTVMQLFDSSGGVRRKDDPIPIGSVVLVNPTFWWNGKDAKSVAPPRAASNDFKVFGGYPLPGTLAQYTAVPLSRVHLAPSHLTSAQAAALPLVGATAWRAVVTQAELKAGDLVLVTGIGSGVAVMAAQFAVALGACVYVTSSSKAKIDRAVKELGAAGGFDYNDAKWPAAARKALTAKFGADRKFDAVIDGAGGANMNQYVRMMRPGGIIVSYGATAGVPADFNVFALFLQQLQLRGTAMCSDDEFRAMLEFVNQHRIVPCVDAEYELADVSAALDRMRSGAQFGKIVIKIPQADASTAAGATPLRSKL